MLEKRQGIPDTFLEFFLQAISQPHCAHCQQFSDELSIPSYRMDNETAGPPFDQLMAALAMYFNHFFAKKDADEGGDDMLVARSQAEEQMLMSLTFKMKDAEKRFGVVYNAMVSFCRMKFYFDNFRYFILDSGTRYGTASSHESWKMPRLYYTN